MENLGLLLGGFLQAPSKTGRTGGADQFDAGDYLTCLIKLLMN